MLNKLLTLSVHYHNKVIQNVRMFINFVSIYWKSFLVEVICFGSQIHVM